MEIRLILLVFLPVIIIQNGDLGPLNRLPLQNFDKKWYYNILRTGEIKDIDQELTVVSALPAPDRDAYSGALLMKKAGLLKKPKDKLESFTIGRIRLETAIHADSGKVEYRFLRLVIQEHAPKITKYHDQLKEDGETIRQKFNQLPPDVQQVIKDYSTRFIKPTS
jgi:hypothetical protein